MYCRGGNQTFATVACLSNVLSVQHGVCTLPSKKKASLHLPNDGSSTGWQRMLQKDR